MQDGPIQDVRNAWDAIAADWEIQVGDEGDSNRILNSDPVLWQFAGDVLGRDVLDAGCGTGYLSRKLHQRGARVIGVDLSPKMIDVAQTKSPDLDFRVDSCSQLATIPSDTIDLVVANYVLMDTPDLDGTMRAFARVLRNDGDAVVVFSHPCFPQGRAVADGATLSYSWERSYFENGKNVDPPWAHFTAPFTWFHRPLSTYWKAFREAGFDVIEFDEPRLQDERPPEPRHDAKMLQKCRTRPYSVAFKLRVQSGR